MKKKSFCLLPSERSELFSLNSVYASADDDVRSGEGNQSRVVLEEGIVGWDGDGVPLWNRFGIVDS